MNKEAEIEICEAFLKNIGNQNINKRKRLKQSRTQQWKHQHRFADPCSSDVSLLETAVKADDVSHCLLNAADSSTINEDFRNEVQEIGQQTNRFSTCELKNTVALQHETNVLEKGKRFQEDADILLNACESEHVQIQTKDFYLNKIESLHKNYIEVLLREREKCKKEFEQAQTKRKQNRSLINKRLDTMEMVLRSLTALNKRSNLNVDKFLREQREINQVIRDKVKESVCCDILRLEMKKNKKEQNCITRKNEEIKNIREKLLQTKNELKAVKKELEEKVSIIKQHSYYEQERNLEINKLKVDVNTYKIQLAQAQDKQESECKKLFDEMKVIQDSLENNANVKSCMTETESDLEEVQKKFDYSSNFSKPAPSQQEGTINFNKLEEAEVYSEQVAQTQCQLQPFHKENNAVLETYNTEEKNKAELSKLQTHLAGTQQVLEIAKKILSSKMKTIEQKVQHEQKIMEQLNKAEEDVKALGNQLAQTKKELEVVKQELHDEVHIIYQNTPSERKEIELGKVKEVELLQTQLTETQQTLENVKKMLTSKINIIQQNVQHEQKIIKQLNKAEEDKKILQDQLTETQNKLENVKKQLEKEIELGKVKKVELLQLTGTQHELEETRNNNLITLTQKSQNEQKVMEELNKAEENVKLLQSQLAALQHELETARKELNDRVNDIQEEQIEKEMVIGFLKIRLMLIKKLGFPDQYDQHFENYVKERNSRGIASDIQRLIEDKVQLRDEPISKTAIGSNILQVTENEVHLVVTIACFLKVVPFSASTDFIYSFVAQIDNIISRQQVESLLKKFPTIFKEELVSAGTSNNNWRYLYLKPIITI